MAQTPGLTNYEEIQEMEVQALQSIYGDDFAEEEAKAGAWNKKTERAFRLTLKPPSYPETGLSVVLRVRLPNTYPKTAPVCILEFDDLVPVPTQKAIEVMLKDKTKSMLGQEMIYEIADTVQAELDTSASKMAEVGNVPTLEEERAAQQAEAKQREEEIIAERLEKQRSAENEEERQLKHMVEMVRAKQKKHQSKVSFSSEAPISEGSFDTKVKVKNRDGVVKEFSSISNKTKYRVGPVTTVYTAASAPSATDSTTASSEPNDQEDDEELPFVVLKECRITAVKPSSKLNQSIETLESDLRSLQELQLHQGVCTPLAFRLEKVQSDWIVRVLLPFHEKGSLYDLIETMGTLDAKHIRAYVIQLLDALEFLHRHRIVHGRISAKNILLERNETGVTVVKLADALYQHELHQLQNTLAKFSSASSAYWIAPEAANNDSIPSATKDVWDLGLVILQMAFGLEIQQQFNSPTSLIEGTNLSESFEDLLLLFFKADSKKRPVPFNLVASEFLRSDKPIFDDGGSQSISRVTSINSPMKTPTPRRDSQHQSGTTSRYATEFTEQGRLGKGGFGEVVKARNRIDGGVYAIKKVTLPTGNAFNNVLGEVMLLSRLNNPYIVRYYGAWSEQEGIYRRTSTATEDMESAENYIQQSMSQLTVSKTQELDFVSSSGMAGFEFGYDSGDEQAIANTDDEEESNDEFNDEQDDDDEEEGDEESGDEDQDDDEDEEDDDEEFDESSSVVAPAAPRRRRSSAVGFKITLYIQMEYCDRRTLRDLIRDNLHAKTEECWRLFRQIVEGLVYVHGNGVIHRDLKPENIFISNDQSATIRIGDFGLARHGEASAQVRRTGFTDPRLTASIGTSIYVAPEVKSSGGGNYNEKADMYSLGIMLFEMSYPVKTGMERAKILTDLREKDSKLPDAFDKPLNAEIITELVKHKVSERPSSKELLRSGKIPSHVEDETIKGALRSLADKSSPYYTRFIKGLFAQGSSDGSLDYAFDLDTGLKFTPEEQILNSWIQDQMVAVFQRHGAVRVQRPKLVPYSPQFYGDNVAQLLNSDGNVIQLPYDLTLPFARLLSKSDVSTMARKSFTFGTVFRESPAGVHPRMVGEVDFDIVSDDSLDLALREAEVIKVIDEIVGSIPSLVEANIFYHISHSKLLNAILAWCKVPTEKRTAVKQSLSRLNIGAWNWSRLKTDLRSSQAIPSTCLEDLGKFNFCENYATAIEKLRVILQDTGELESTFRHLGAITTYLSRFYVKRGIFINPLASLNEKFYHGNVLFQCIHRTTRKKKVFNDVLAAGGRYDGLISDLRTGSKSGAKHAVGFNMAWKSITASMLALQQQSEAGKAFLKSGSDLLSSLPKNRRCDVLVDSVEPAMLRSSGIRIVNELWANDISAELIIDSDVLEGKSHRQQSKDDASNHLLTVLIKQDDNLRVRSMITKEDTELRVSELVGWIKAEMRERERSDGSKKPSQLKREASEGIDRDANVFVLTAQNKSKKANRRNIVEDAQARTSQLSQSFLDCPIAAVELKDELFEGIRETRISDPESWRRYIQSAPLADRKYLGQLHELLLEKSEDKEDGKSSRSCWVYNFRTRACLLYDLGKAS